MYFLREAVGLKELDLWDNDIEALSPLAALTDLRQLWVPYNLISDLSPLAGLDKLAKLHVYGNQITSLEPLRALTSLNHLNLQCLRLAAANISIRFSSVSSVSAIHCARKR